MDITVLYVDSLLNNDNMGYTSDPNTIAYNNGIMGDVLKDRFTDLLNQNDGNGIIIGCIGRYMFTVEIKLDARKYQMAFIDFKDDENEAKRISSMSDSEIAKLQMDNFHEHRKDYHRLYNSVKLVKGKPPVHT